VNNVLGLRWFDETHAKKVKSLSLYLHFITLRIRAQMAYRFSFTLELLSQASVSVIDFLMIAILFERFKQLANWTLWEVGLLYGIISICFALAEMVARGFDTFQNLVVRGAFDNMLIRPLGTFYQVFAHEFQLRRVGRLIQGLVVFLIANSHLDISWSLGKLGYLCLALTGGTCFFIGLLVVGATSCFWTVQSIEIINIFTHGGIFMGSYPISIYQRWFRHFFTFIIPLACVNYFPSVFLLNKFEPAGTSRIVVQFAPFIGILFLSITGLFWKWGVSHYQSTGH